MTDYVLITMANHKGLRWEYKFSMESDVEAIEYAKEKTAGFVGVSWFRAMLLYRESIRYNDEASGCFIGRFMIDEPTVTMD